MRASWAMTLRCHTSSPSGHTREPCTCMPAAPRSGTDDMGERLPCTVRSVAEVRTITEQAYAVLAAKRLTLVPQTVRQARVNISAMSTRGTVMLEEGPGPLGLCPMRGVADVNWDTTIWLDNSGPRPVEVAPDQVVALAERVSESEGMENGDDGANMDEVMGLVRCAAQQLTKGDRQQLAAALHPRRHLFAAGKGDTRGCSTPRWRELTRGCSWPRPDAPRPLSEEQHIVRAPMERLAMDVAAPYPVRSSGNQY